MSAIDFGELLASAPRGAGEVHVRPGPLRTVEVVLDNPVKRNALSPYMMARLGDVARHPDVRQASVVIFRGEGGAFCSGGDLDAVAEHLAVPGVGYRMAQFMGDVMDALVDTGAVLVGVLDGPALGGGAELLVACDEIYASPAASFGFVHARMGVSPGFGGGGRLVAKLGTRRALAIATAYKPLRGPSLEATGLVDHWSADPLAAARARAAELTQLPQAALAGVVRVIRGHGRVPDPQGRQNEVGIFGELWGGPAHQAALRARK